ncbi:hypothetical protein CHELA40_13424 [Chelatococcus asaccharovorans]|nr:hypothetical protein CHELA40_13424 [Chelatococcus asaccharovorans]
MFHRICQLRGVGDNRCGVSIVVFASQARNLPRRIHNYLNNSEFLISIAADRAWPAHQLFVRGDRMVIGWPVPPMP